MRYASAVLGLSIALLTGACGNDGNGGTGPAPMQENIAGDYAGVMGGTVQGVTMNADFALTLNQSGGQLSGSSVMAGTLTDGIDVVAIAGTGALTGTIGTGINPPVSLTAHSDACPTQSTTFTGTYDSANHRLQLTGSVGIVNSSCQVVLTYPMNMTLFR